MNIVTYWDDVLMEYVAHDADNYDGLPDGNNELGYGNTRQEAIEDLEERFLLNSNK